MDPYCHQNLSSLPTNGVLCELHTFRLDSVLHYLKQLRPICRHRILVVQRDQRFSEHSGQVGWVARIPFLADIGAS